MRKGFKKVFIIRPPRDFLILLGAFAFVEETP
jgi:hypothetical protein